MTTRTLLLVKPACGTVTDWHRAFETLLIAAVGCPVLPVPGFGAPRQAAIALTAIAMRTNPEHRLASLAAANALPDNHFSMNHPFTPAAQMMSLVPSKPAKESENYVL